MAYAAKLAGRKHRVLVVMSDGECDEGSNWEAILFAAHHGLSNLTAIVDYNKIQSLAPVSETLNLEPFADKWASFCWDVRTADGHDHADLKRAMGTRRIASGLPWSSHTRSRVRVCRSWKTPCSGTTGHRRVTSSMRRSRKSRSHERPVRSNAPRVRENRSPTDPRHR